MSIQFVHHNNEYHEKGKYTLAIETPTTEGISQVLAEFMSKGVCQFGIKMGRADCSKHDQYSKKTGRDLATARIQVQGLNVSKVHASAKEIVIYASPIRIQYTRATDSIRVLDYPYGA